MNKNVLRIVAIVNAISGLMILFSVIYPIVSYQSPASTKLISPLGENVSPLFGATKTNASSWFPGGAKKEDFVSSEVKYYTISIPKLRIENAVVSIGGEDLSKSLIHYPGTALPGKRGNSVIFGHSALPIFYNPKNYITIFSLLPTLRPGDEIFIEYDGISFKYKVEEMVEVLPTDLQVLDQDTSDSFITLVTCVPPGDPRTPRRLIVRARIVPPS